MKKQFTLAATLGFLLSINSFSQVSLVKDFFPGASGSFKNNGEPNSFKVHNDRLYVFASESPTESNNLYEFTSLGNTPVKIKSNVGVLKGYNFADGGMISSGNNLYFFNQKPASLDDILYVYDGTHVTELVTIPYTFFYPYKGLSLDNGSILFLNTSTDSGLELWITDGTVAGTRLVKDINSGKGNVSGQFAGLNGFSFKEKAYFMANDGNGPEVWVSDGTEAGTGILKDEVTTGNSNQYVALPYAKNDNYFIYQGANFNVYASDGTTAGTQSIGTYENAPINFYTEGLTMGAQTSGYMYFTAKDGSTRLYKTDGTQSNTTVVTDQINASLLTYITEYNGSLYGLYSNPTTSKVDLLSISSSGISTIKTFSDANLSTTTTSSFGRISVADGKMYFRGVDGSAGIEYWESDGTTEGTKMLNDFTGFGTADGAKPHNIVFDDTFVFSAEDASSGGVGIELWAAKGSLTTGLSEQVNAASFSLYPNPSSGSIQISTSDNTTKVITIYNSSGAKVLEETSSDEHIRLAISTLPQGVYLVHCNGSSVRFIKK